MRKQTNDSSIPGLAHIIRIVLFFIPRTLLGPVLFYSVIYWWFVPALMRLDIPLSFPSTGLKIVASLFAILLMLVSFLSSEALASSLPERWTTSLHRIIAPASFLLNILSGLSALCLFTPLIGIPALPPPAVLLIFGGLVLSLWLKSLKKGLGIFAHIDAGKQRPSSIVGPSAPELLANDKRPPILYLRSFTKERSKASTLGRFSYIRGNRAGFYLVARRPSPSDSFSAFIRKMLVREYRTKFFDSNRSVRDEQMLFAEYFSEFGPYIAIGRPGEAFEGMDLGAAKYYVPDEAWTTKVVELINSSGAIVIEAAESEGLSWEIREVVSRVAPEKVLLILPRNEADYREFCILAARLFPHSMPEKLPKTRLLMFGVDWTPIPLENATMILEDALRPFVDRLSLGSSRDKKPNQANAANAK